MARIVAVHGIGQQFKGNAIIHSEWWAPFLSGLQLAGRELTDEREFTCPFYGHLFRPPGAMSVSDSLRVDDIGEEEAELLKRFWLATSAVDQTVPSPEEFGFGMSLARTPQFLQRALNALSQSSFWANASESLLIGDLRQVVRYFKESDLHDQILNIVLNQISGDTQVVIGHSLGSVVAYEALCQKPANVVSFISLGSPLAIRNLIFDKLTPRPNTEEIGAWPGKIKYWTNIADKGDIVALEKQLHKFFGDDVKDILVFNGSNAHHGENYLTTKEVGEAACEGLWGTKASDHRMTNAVDH